MHTLYNFSIRVYGIAIFIFSFFNKKAKSWIKGRKNWRKQLENLPQNVIWFHCASLGEFDQGLPMMKEMKLMYPNHFLLVTFFSPSGMDHYHKRNHCVDLAIYLPLDSRQNAIDFLNITRPKMGVFVKYEFWANYILEAKKLNIKLVSIATILRKNQIYFKAYVLVTEVTPSRPRFANPWCGVQPQYPAAIKRVGPVDRIGQINVLYAEISHYPPLVV